VIVRIEVLVKGIAGQIVFFTILASQGMEFLNHGSILFQTGRFEEMQYLVILPCGLG